MVTTGAPLDPPGSELQSVTTKSVVVAIRTPGVSDSTSSTQASADAVHAITGCPPPRICAATTANAASATTENAISVTIDAPPAADDEGITTGSPLRGGRG